jgi:GntR family transcriptional regulator
MMPEGKDTKITEAVAELQRRMDAGIYAAGQRLPSERELAEDMTMSRPTIRAALLRLQGDNSIDIVPRAGAFVRSPAAKALMGPAAFPTARGAELIQAGSFIRAMQAQGRTVLVRFITPSKVLPAGEEIGQKLHTDLGTLVLRRYRVHLVDRVPYRILDSFYLASLLGPLEGKDSGYIPLFRWLQEHTGKRAARAYENLRCRMPSAEEATLLNIARNQPVVDMDRWVWTDDDVLFEYSRIIANAALHEFAYAYEISEEASR